MGDVLGMGVSVADLRSETLRLRKKRVVTAICTGANSDMHSENELPQDVPVKHATAKADTPAPETGATFDVTV